MFVQVTFESLGKHQARLLYLPDWLDLTPSNVRITIEGQVSVIIGDGLKLRAAAAAYFL
jgi:hypothetical protein